MNPKMRTNQNSINSYENYKHLRTYKMPDTLKNFYFDDFNSIKQNQYDMSKYNATVSELNIKKYLYIFKKIEKVFK